MSPVPRNEKQKDIYDPQRWGLCMEAIEGLGERLYQFWNRYRGCFKTRTRDTSIYAHSYLRGLLTMEAKRTYANIARRVINREDDGQNTQQFMSDSPWDAKQVFYRIQDEITANPLIRGGMLCLDESGDEKAGDRSAGAARQYLGRYGTVGMGQVGVCLSYHQGGTWAMVDAELFFPEGWFDREHAKLWERWHIPKERRFASKVQLGLEMIRKARRNSLPFSVVGCDSLYGRNNSFRSALDAEGITYMADIPCNLEVYLEEPEMKIPESPPGKKGRPYSWKRMRRKIHAVEARQVMERTGIQLQPVEIRYTERGTLVYDCAAQRIWKKNRRGEIRPEWLFIRREPDGALSYSLSNAPEDTPLSPLAQWRSERYFVERTFQDTKSEIGWDELEARKYRAWMHHTALSALALWFVAETKLAWAHTYPPDPELAQQLEIAILPALSVSNVRELLKTVLPLHQFKKEEAAQLVIKHLVNRSLSTRSRFKTQHKNNNSS
jgi:SRSO17 transposase